MLTRRLFTIAAFALTLGHASTVFAKDIQTAIFAGGCFWCVEADMDKIKGVKSTTSGFSGGTVKNVTYKQVTAGGTGHYEVVEVKFDADVVSYEALINAFWRSIDPLDAGGQFCDRGESYRTAIFATTPEQRAIAEATKAEVRAALGKNIATVIEDAGEFYPASRYHQGYYKSKKVVLTRFGPLTKAKAYKRYRDACGRDARVQAVWGAQAFPGS
jgi:peptide-methionine (S)-S-oxide reductase